MENNILNNPSKNNCTNKSNGCQNNDIIEGNKEL